MIDLKTKMVGMFNLPDGKAAMKVLVAGDNLFFEREPHNQHDKNAVALYAESLGPSISANMGDGMTLQTADLTSIRTKIAYLPRDVAAQLADFRILKVVKTADSWDSISIEADKFESIDSIEVTVTVNDGADQTAIGVFTDEELDYLRRIQAKAHGIAKASGWWTDLKTGAPLVRNKGELLMLMVSELAEAMEGERKDLMDDKLPHRKMGEVEMADCVIRILDYCGGFGYDLAGAMAEKMAYNAQREDHKLANRAAEGGKKF